MIHSALRRLGVFAALLLACVAISCDSVSGPRFGRVSLFLTDAPGDVTAAVVTIERIYLQGGGDDADDDSTDVDDDSTDVDDDSTDVDDDSTDVDDEHGGRVVLLNTPVTVDLLTLRDSLMSMVDLSLVPAGRYHQLRLVISGGYIAVAGADSAPPAIYATSPDYAGLPDDAVVTGALHMPSAAHSGLKVKLPPSAIRVDPNGVVTLVIDFDVAKSFGKLAGGSGRWVMSPVITATEVPVP